MHDCLNWASAAYPSPETRATEWWEPRVKKLRLRSVYNWPLVTQSRDDRLPCLYTGRRRRCRFQRWEHPTCTGRPHWLAGWPRALKIPLQRFISACAVELGHGLRGRRRSPTCQGGNAPQYFIKIHVERRLTVYSARPAVICIIIAFWTFYCRSIGFFTWSLLLSTVCYQEYVRFTLVSVAKKITNLQ